MSKYHLSLRIGTRASRLAEWQAEWVANRLRDHYPELGIELVRLKTQGDRDQASPLSTIGGTGLFTKEIQRALLDETVDLAVHSLKDLPTICPPALVLGAVPRRAAVSDALIAPVYQTLERMPAGACLGTGSSRRQAQVLWRHPNLSVVPIRGNIETRLNLALEGKLDGVILAAAALERLNLQHHVTQQLAPPDFLPAVGQGALGIECRADDGETQNLVQVLDCQETHTAALAERAVLAELEGGCSIPLGAWARQIVGQDGTRSLVLDAAVFDPRGQRQVRTSQTGSVDDPVTLGREVARVLRAHGADSLLRASRSS
ncbi:MAG: hydroxymethylbilane synthase [Isosphaeraceae bacterium]